MSDAASRPRHIAIIMDGNNRWAKQQGLKTLSGHKEGVERVRDIMRACQRFEVETLTLFAFSSENWQRPKTEVAGLMTLFATYLKKETPKLKEEGVCLRIIGSRERLSDKLKRLIDEAEEQTKGGKLTLVLAVDYGGKWDIAQAAQRMAQKVKDSVLSVEQISEEMLDREVSLNDLPPVDLMIRTSGEQRISNFLLWQCAYSEFYFTNVYWPDFDEAELEKAIQDFSNRQRRYGLTAEQIVAQDTAESN